jgi:hypothetical protein
MSEPDRTVTIDDLRGFVGHGVKHAIFAVKSMLQGVAARQAATGRKPDPALLGALEAIVAEEATFTASIIDVAMAELEKAERKPS